MKTTILIGLVFFYSSFSFADDNYEKVPELMGKSMTLLVDVYLDGVVDYQFSDEEDKNPFTYNDDYKFIYEGELLSTQEFENVHDDKSQFCVVSVYRRNTDKPNTVLAGSVSSVIESGTSLKGHNWKNGRYNWIIVQSYVDNDVKEATYISSLECVTPEPGIFRKPQMTAADILRLTNGIVAFE